VLAELWNRVIEVLAQDLGSGIRPSGRCRYRTAQNGQPVRELGGERACPGAECSALVAARGEGCRQHRVKVP